MDGGEVDEPEYGGGSGDSRQCPQAGFEKSRRRGARRDNCIIPGKRESVPLEMDMMELKCWS